jgi:hypothetical protein
MCRPSCCDNSRGQGTGIAAVAVILGAAVIAAKIGPIVARIVQIALEVFRVVALTAAVVLMFTVAVWLTVMIVRWWLRHYDARRQAILQPVNITAWRDVPTGDQSACLACGGSGKVLRAISSSRYQPSACPVREPAEWAG